MDQKYSDEELKKRLTPEQFRALREGENEYPYTGKFLHNKAVGLYTCPVCGNVLFDSKTKFESDSGWPSFYDVASKGSVRLVEDNSHGMHRVEVRCAVCGSHLGHVFNDSPDQPTGMRFCISSDALDFKKK